MSRYSTNAIREPRNKNDKVYPCAYCGKLRSERQGALIFTICGDCWKKAYPEKELGE